MKIRMVFMVAMLFALSSCIFVKNNTMRDHGFCSDVSSVVDQNLNDTSAVICGTVKDALSRDIVPFVDIEITNLNIKGKTDRSGNFSFCVPVGLIRLSVNGRKFKYDDFRCEKMILKPREKRTILIGLGGSYIE